MKLSLGQLRKLIREAVTNPTSTDEIVARHQAPHVYVRYDEQPFEPELSFVGYNPNDHNNHEGVWVYLLEFGKPDEGAFAITSPYVTVLTVRSPDRMLRSDNYTEDDLKRDIEKLNELYGADVVAQVFEQFAEHSKFMRDELESMRDDNPEFVAQALEALDVGTPFERLELLATGLNKVTPRRRRLRNFYLDLGYVGIEDPMGIIDTIGNTGVIFDPNQVEVIARYKNPDSTS